MDLWLTINKVDYYLSRPLPSTDIPTSSTLEASFLAHEVSYTNAFQVPVVRLFGTTLGGQKTLVHLHGVRTA